MALKEDEITELKTLKTEAMVEIRAILKNPRDILNRA